MKNFHVLLPEETYAQLRTEAERAKVPATALAREAIDIWLRQQARAARHNAIAELPSELLRSIEKGIRAAIDLD